VTALHGTLNQILRQCIHTGGSKDYAAKQSKTAIPDDFRQSGIDEKTENCRRKVLHQTVGDYIETIFRTPAQNDSDKTPAKTGQSGNKKLSGHENNTYAFRFSG
jgi:hypothetical protein